MTTLHNLIEGYHQEPSIEEKEILFSMIQKMAEIPTENNVDVVTLRGIEMQVTPLGLAAMLGEEELLDTLLHGFEKTDNSLPEKRLVEEQKIAEEYEEEKEKIEAEYEEEKGASWPSKMFATGKYTM